MKQKRNFKDENLKKNLEPALFCGSCSQSDFRALTRAETLALAT